MIGVRQVALQLCKLTFSMSALYIKQQEDYVRSTLKLFYCKQIHDCIPGYLKFGVIIFSHTNLIS